MSDEVLLYLVLIAPGILLISIALSCIRWQVLPPAFRRLLAYLVWNFLLETVVYFLPPGTNNLPLLHLHTLIEFILFSWVYGSLGIFPSAIQQRLYQYLGIAGALIVLNSLFIQPIDGYNTYSRTIIQCVLIAYSILYILQLNKNREKRRAHDVMNSAVLLFYSGSLFVFMFGNILLNNEYGDSFWVFNLALNVLFQVLILLSIWLASRDKKSPYLSHSAS